MHLTDAYELACALMTQHGLSGWTVEFDGAKKRAGICRFRERVIGLSAPLTRLHSEAEVRDTILHEIAHAMVGPRHGHGPVWRRQALAIGCSGERCVPSDSPRIEGSWLGTCPAGHTTDQHRRPARVKSCSRCAPTFTIDHVFEWTYRGRPAPMHPNYDAELESLRAGASVRRLGAGTRVRITAPGRFSGRVGRIEKVGRTRYHVRLRDGLVTVVFAAVDRA